MPTDAPGMARWRKKLFTAIARNAADPVAVLRPARRADDRHGLAHRALRTAALSRESTHGRPRSRGALQRREVRGARDPHERPGGRQLAGEPLAEADEVLDVVGADDHERRDADLAEPARDGRVGLLELGVDAHLGLERGALHGRDEVDDGGVDVAVAARDPRADVGLHRRGDVARVERRLLLGGEGRELVATRRTRRGPSRAARAPATRSGARSARSSETSPPKDAATTGTAVEPELVEQGDQRAGVRDDPGLERGAPEAGQVGRDRPVPAATRRSASGSHMRPSAMPAWTSRTAGPSPRTSWCSVTPSRPAGRRRRRCRARA